MGQITKDNKILQKNPFANQSGKNSLVSWCSRVIKQLVYSGDYEALI